MWPDFAWYGVLFMDKSLAYQSLTAVIINYCLSLVNFSQQ